MKYVNISAKVDKEPLKLIWKLENAIIFTFTKYEPNAKILLPLKFI